MPQRYYIVFNVLYVWHFATNLKAVTLHTGANISEPFHYNNESTGDGQSNTDVSNAVSLSPLYDNKR